MARIINYAGLALIKEAEGYRDHAYQDTGGVWSIGYGHTRGVKQGDTCNPSQAEYWLEADLMDAEAAVSKLVKVPLTDNQFAALVSFVFNVGSSQLEKSTLLRKLNEGGYDLVPACLKSWIFDNGKVQPGLVKRRASEAALWSIKP
jgi:lysozyme